MKIWTLLLAVLCMAEWGNAQTTPNKISCGYDHAVAHMTNLYPSYKTQIKEVFKNAEVQGQESLSRSNDIYKIPVIVHVVWKDSSENIADSIIHSQIDVLNEDFRRMNPDANNVRTEFEAVVGDPMIEFELVDIIRTETTAEFEVSLSGLPDEVKQSSNGGSDAWDTDAYLNIWVCKIKPLSFGGIDLGLVLGYAYPPADLPNWPTGVAAPSPELDGVVIDFRAFGKNNPNEIANPTSGLPLETVGRTTVHEVGHYLGLRHIWGDGGGLLGGDSCGEDDGILDTPNSGTQSGFNCDLNQNSCIDPVDDLPDMIENYMDYAQETCMNSFTMGQIAVMRGVLEGPRCNLVNACTPTSVNTLDNLNSLLVFPNPTSGDFTIQIQGRDLEHYEFQIFDVNGKAVNNAFYQSGNQISTINASKGLYLIQLSNEEEIITERLIIN